MIKEEKMPINTPWFSKVGLEYAKLYNEVMAAQRLYESDRKRIMDHLCAQLKKALGKRKIFQQKKYGDWENFFLDGEYCEVRKRRDPKNKPPEQAGICMDFGKWEDEPFGFGALLFFKLNRGTFNRLRLEEPPDSLIKTIGAGEAFESFHVEGYYILQTGWLLPSDPSFTLDELEKVVQQLPRQFEIADRWIAKEYTQLKGLEE